MDDSGIDVGPLAIEPEFEAAFQARQCHYIPDIPGLGAASEGFWERLMTEMTKERLSRVGHGGLQENESYKLISDERKEYLVSNFFRAMQELV